MKKLILGLACFSALTFTSCEKDSDDTKTKTEMITSHGWTMTGLDVEPGIDMFVDGTWLPVTDVFLQMNDCSKDNEVIFNANGTLIEETNSKCHPAEPATYTGTWSFNSDETRLVLNTDESIDYKLELLDDNNLVVSYTENDEGVNVEFTMEFSK